MAEVDRAVLVTAVSEMAVLRALQLAGNRLLGKRGRSVRGPMKDVEPWSIHVHLPVAEHELDALLKDAWQIPVAVGLPGGLLDALDAHVRTLLAAGMEFRRDDLLLTLSQLPQFVLPWEAPRSFPKS
ncbi:hypothetical protein [Streptomyces botrytidirepellens]|uniref:Uncharacterized protein n=1 Tax=Streptomyces botrytidirepellens TaxID=2486417 RepID=A0A3M8TN95_9ACTN|nr:hypothetical protein [Streptomyces botrytidirepellens]RNF94877.1 hypothetical protein EEJ42_38095 [Streptomyces botrytidirepellens]